MIKYNDLVQLFEDVNTPLLLREEVISLNLIKASNFLFENFNINTKVTTDKLNKLYESIIEFNPVNDRSNSILFNKNKPLFEHELILEPNKLNPISYLINVEKLATNNISFSSTVMAHESVNNLKLELRKVIENLKFQNEFDNLLFTNKYVEATKRFSKNIKISGFNVYDIENLIDNYNLTNEKPIPVKCILLDKSNKQMLIFTGNDLLAYDILTDNLDNFNLINKNYPVNIGLIVDKSVDLFIEFVRSNICNNIEMIYNTEINSKIKFTESLYKENSRFPNFMNELKAKQKLEKLKENSIIK